MHHFYQRNIISIRRASLYTGVHQFRRLNATPLITSGTDARVGEAVAAALERSMTKTG